MNSSANFKSDARDCSLAIKHEL